ncbi:Serine/threonine protein phosphatase PP1 [Tritrichomonas foetus]|uniref:Serine/threonine-protein phosphatase n=1 Tax=Tritrichomonas foetus TaxID=1144522 RepID=A0A1J4J4M1_9EUKA|nr:Serine/threonine protein phosphatase PP1 [Tritrichomonas foetus]|eukprot:OHS93095.1 Serine/threonine protein phosphatase PP1 [Tritrichomonas foetus]
MNDVDQIITKLLSIRDKTPGTRAKLTKKELFYLINNVKPIFLEQPMLLELCAPIIIVGDVHGQFHDCLLKIFEATGFPPKRNYLFLGDYVDRGSNSLETICLLFAYKIKYPENIFLLRGNHECSKVNRLYGFYEEIMNEYKSPDIWPSFNSVFECMPVSAIIEDKYFCVHGGLSQELDSIQDIISLQRPTEVADEGLLIDLLWSDPNTNAGCLDFEKSERGASYLFSERIVRDFLLRNCFSLVIRAHQTISGGFTYPFGENGGMLTVYSAPCSVNGKASKGSFIDVAEDLDIKFYFLEPLNLDE